MKSRSVVEGLLTVILDFLVLTWPFVATAIASAMLFKIMMGAE